MRSWLAGLLSISAIPGCEYPDCRWGVWPVDGATGVPLDTVIEFTSDGPLPELLPEEIGEALKLRVENGPAVPFEVEIEDNVLRLIPTEPLSPGKTYVARGVDMRALRRADTHWWGPYELESVSTRFQTGGAPRIIKAVQGRKGHVVVAFSEPMDLASLTLSVELVDAGTTDPSTSTVPPTCGSYGYYGYYGGCYGYYGYYGSGTGMTLTEPVPLRVLGYYKDNPLLVELGAGEYTPYVSGYGLDVRVDPRSRSVRGPLLDPRASRVAVRGRYPRTEPRWLGLPSCSR